MKLKAAIKVAIKQMEKRLKNRELNFDANLYDQGIADYAAAERASKERKQLKAAITTLTAELEDKNG